MLLNINSSSSDSQIWSHHFDEYLYLFFFIFAAIQPSWTPDNNQTMYFVIKCTKSEMAPVANGLIQWPAVMVTLILYPGMAPPFNRHTAEGETALYQW